MGVEILVGLFTSFCFHLLVFYPLIYCSTSGSERDLQSLLSSMSQQQLMQLFGNVGGMSGLSSLLVPSEK